MKTLKPCPYCGKIEYSFATSWTDVIGDSLKVVPTLLSQGISKGVIISSFGSGLGIFSFPKMIYQALILKMESNPILLCRHCKQYVISCPKCNTYLHLLRRPGNAEVIECQPCKARFVSCEINQEFRDMGVSWL